MDEQRIAPATLVATGILSAAMLAFELALTRLFAVVQFYHFAFMVISLALLGSGAAGSLLSVQPKLAKWPALWGTAFGLSVLASYAVLNLIPFDSYAIAWDRRQVLYLILSFAGPAVPFLFSGLVVGGLLTAHPRALHRIYAANLAGSAAGCALALPLLASVGGEGTLFLSAAAGLLAGGAFLFPTLRERWRGGDIGFTAVGVMCIGALVVLAVVRPAWAGLRLSPYKGLAQALLAPDARHTFSRWSIQARVDVVESSSIHQFPGLSQNVLMPHPPVQAGLMLDGNNAVAITALAPTDELARRLANHIPEAVVHVLRPDASSMLVLEPGGGWNVLMALADGARSVTVVEHNPVVVALLQGPYADFSGDLYHNPRVQVVVMEGRTFVRRVQQSYPIILIALSDPFYPVTSGAYSLSEDYRYTVEAISDYLSRLESDGVLVLTRWVQTPPVESLRMLATIEQALRAQGVDRPADHIAALRSLRTITFVVSRQPLTGQEQDTIRSFAAERGYDLVWLPAIAPEEVNRYFRSPEPVDYLGFRDLLADPRGFVAGCTYDIRPATDDRPFFFHYFRWRQTPQVIAGLGRSWQPFGGSGYLVLVALLLLVIVLAVVMILAPLLVRRGGAQTGKTLPALRWCVFVYYAMLGLGFMFIELPLAQRFILFVGHPVTALAVVLCSLLLFSGLGSLSAPRWRLEVALGLLVVVALVTPVVVHSLSALVLGWPLAVRVVLVAASVAPLGVLMGVPFARGTLLVERISPGLIAWAWAINGSTSVISSVVAVMLALSMGFSAVLWMGAGAYLIALIALGSVAVTHPAPRG
jgi:hypothetical protein